MANENTKQQNKILKQKNIFHVICFRINCNCSVTDVPLSHASYSWRYPNNEYSYPNFWCVYKKIKKILIIFTHCFVSLQSLSYIFELVYWCDLLVISLQFYSFSLFLYLLFSKFIFIEENYWPIQNVTNQAIQQSNHIPFITETTRKQSKYIYSQV